MSGHGGNLRAAAQRYGRDELSFLDFSANINPYGLPDPIAAALHDAVAHRMTSYPDPDCVALRAAIGLYDGCDPAWILCGNGASELIQIAFDAIRPKRALLFCPGFSDYERSARLCGAELVFEPLAPENGFLPDDDALHGALGRLSPGDALITGQPNNPSSTLWPIERLRSLAAACRDRGVYLLIDEAFLPLTLAGEDASLRNELQNFPQTLLFRAFTKSLALPGLRLGYAIAAPDLLARLKSRQVCWSVSAFAQAVAPALCALDDYRAKTRAWLESELPWQFEALALPGLRAFLPATNFILARVENGLGARELCDRAAKQGVLIRDASNFRGLDERFIRVGVKLREDNRALIHALTRALNG